MDSERIPWYDTYVIQVLKPEGWVNSYHYNNGRLDDALVDMEWISSGESGRHDKAHRLIERVDNGIYRPSTTINIVQEFWPDGEDHGPVKEPISWAEEGF